MYSHGRGIGQNDSEAAYWYRQSAAQGYADAQVQLAVLYSHGGGVEQNDAIAVEWGYPLNAGHFGVSHVL